MSNKQFFNNLSATYADVRKLDVKKINLKGKNILEYISENKTTILDERGTNADDELDIWNSYVNEDENGNVIINRSAKPHVHSIKYDEKDKVDAIYEGITESQHNIIKTAVKVIDNEVLGADDAHLIYWQTDGLTDGFLMFQNCSAFTTFSSDLSNLTNGFQMFEGCSNLSTFKCGDLSNLTNGSYMFYGCSNLSSFNYDVHNLTDASNMFCDCTNLSSFNCTNLSIVEYTNYMFYGCTNLTSFNADLPNVIYAYRMFYGCKLDAQSVANIIHFIPQRDSKPTDSYSNGNITIGLGITNTDEEKQAFAEECDCDSWEELNKDFDDKNWAVEWQFNGEASTFDLRSPRPSTAVYAKLEEVIMPSDKKAHKPHYQYTSQDGSNFYNIHWYHDSNTNNEGYDYFESLEEAISAYGVTPKA